MKCSCKDSQTFVQKSSEFPGKTVKFFCKSWRIFLEKLSNFLLSKIVKIFRKNYQIFLLKLSTFLRKIERMRSIEWFQRTSIITRFKKFKEFLAYFSFSSSLKVFARSYLFVPISVYNYFYIIEIIRAVHSIIPAAELTFLFLHTYLYSKVSICLGWYRSHF